MEVDTVLQLSAAGVHDAVQRWADRTDAQDERRLWLHVEGSGGDDSWAGSLDVRHRQQLLLQFRHVLVQHEVSVRGVPAGCAATHAHARADARVRASVHHVHRCSIRALARHW